MFPLLLRAAAGSRLLTVTLWQMLALFGCVALLWLYRVLISPIVVGLGKMLGNIRIGAWRASTAPLAGVGQWIVDHDASLRELLARYVIAAEAPVSGFMIRAASSVADAGYATAQLAYAVEGALGRNAGSAYRFAKRNKLLAIAAAFGPLSLLVHQVATVAIPALWHRSRHLDDWIGRTARQTRAHARRLTKLEGLLGATAFAALVAVALKRLGLNWLRCPALNRIGRKHGCAPWQLLEYLLAPTVAILLLRDMCTLVTMIQRGAKTAEKTLTDAIVTGEGFLCGGETHLASAVVAADRSGSKGYASGVLSADLRA